MRASEHKSVGQLISFFSLFQWQNSPKLPELLSAKLLTQKTERYLVDNYSQCGPPAIRVRNRVSSKDMTVQNFHTAETTGCLLMHVCSLPSLNTGSKEGIIWGSVWLLTWCALLSLFWCGLEVRFQSLMFEYSID